MTTIERLILFDIDGTLLRTSGAGRNATRDAMIEVFGTAATIDTHHFGGKTDWFTLTTLLADHGYTQESIGIKMVDFIDAIGRSILPYLEQTPARALPGARDAITLLRQNETTLLGIVTGNAPTSGRAKMQSAGFDPAWFPVGAFGSESVDRNDLPRFALERAIAYARHEIDPARCTIIGDTIMDIQAARANNMRVIAVKTGFEDQDALAAAGADHLLDDLTTLFDVL